MLNKDKLVGTIKYNGDTIESYAEYLNIHIDTLKKKMAGKSEFKPSEIALTKKKYHLKPKEVDAIFLNI